MACAFLAFQEHVIKFNTNVGSSGCYMCTSDMAAASWFSYSTCRALIDFFNLLVPENMCLAFWIIRISCLQAGIYSSSGSAATIFTTADYISQISACWILSDYDTSIQTRSYSISNSLCCYLVWVIGCVNFRFNRWPPWWICVRKRG